MVPLLLAAGAAAQPVEVHLDVLPSAAAVRIDWRALPPVPPVRRIELYEAASATDERAVLAPLVRALSVTASAGLHLLVELPDQPDPAAARAAALARLLALERALRGLGVPAGRTRGDAVIGPAQAGRVVVTLRPAASRR